VAGSAARLVATARFASQSLRSARDRENRLPAIRHASKTECARKRLAALPGTWPHVLLAEDTVYFLPSSAVNVVYCFQQSAEVSAPQAGAGRLRPAHASPANSTSSRNRSCCGRTGRRSSRGRYRSRRSRRSRSRRCRRSRRRNRRGTSRRSCGSGCGSACGSGGGGGGSRNRSCSGSRSWSGSHS
jgi:hypothetical protein